MSPQTFILPSDRVIPTSLVLRGIGPAMHIKSAQPSQMLIVTKNRTKTVKMNGSTDIKFAA